MRKTVVLIAAAAMAASVFGCGSKGPDEGAKQTRLQLEEPGANKGLQASGHAEAPLIDPQKKSVVVLAPPSAPQLVARQEAKLTAERDKVETHIHDLMEGYTTNMRNPKTKQKYEQQIAQNLDTYKRQTLELFLMQRQAEQRAAATPR